MQQPGQAPPLWALMGSKRSDITPLPIRFWAVTRFPNFTVVYRSGAKPLQVIAILHSKRDIGTLLEDPVAP